MKTFLDFGSPAAWLRWARQWRQNQLVATCDRVAVLADKRVIAVGTIPELIATGHPWIEEYFNGPRGRAAQSAQDKVVAGRKPAPAKTMDKSGATGD